MDILSTSVSGTESKNFKSCLLGTACSTPTETGSVASEDTDSSTDENEGDSDDDTDDSDGSADESSSDENAEDEVEDGEGDGCEQGETEINEDSPLSPRALSTRARGNVRINLWNLDKK